MNNQNVLILDDEIGFRDEIGDFLTNEGYHVMSAGLPSEALQILESNKVDIGVFDIRLPEIDGISLLGEVKSGMRYKSTTTHRIHPVACHERQIHIA